MHVERRGDRGVREVGSLRVHGDVRVEPTDHVPIRLASVEGTGLEDRIPLDAAVLVREDVIVRQDERLAGVLHQAR